MIECLQIVKTPMGEIFKRIPVITFYSYLLLWVAKLAVRKPLQDRLPTKLRYCLPRLCLISWHRAIQFSSYAVSQIVNTKFRFYWYIFYGTTIGGKDTTYGGLGAYVTSVGRIKWKAPDKLQAYDFEVTADDGDPDLVPVDEAFSVTVKQ